MGRVLVLAGSPNFHVCTAIEKLTDLGWRTDIFISADKLDSFPVSLTNANVVSSARSGKLMLEDINRLPPYYDYAFVVCTVNNLHGSGYSNFGEIISGLGVKQFFLFNIQEQVISGDATYWTLLDRQLRVKLCAAGEGNLLKKNPKYRILVDGTQLAGKLAGLGHFTYMLCRELSRNADFEVFVLCASPDMLDGINATFVYLDLIPDSEEVAEALNDFIESNSITVYVGTYRALPRVLRCRSLMIIHDLIALKFPHFSDSAKSYTYFDVVLRRSVRDATKVVTISESTKRDVITYFDIADQNISIIYPGPGRVSIAASNKDREIVRSQAGNYILYVGTIEPRKGVRTLLGAYDLARKALPNVLSQPFPELVLVGAYGWGCSIEYEWINSPDAKNIRHLGYVTDEQLVELYEGALFVVYPSQYEGFGLPVLEAMSFGVPVITTLTSSLPEIGGNSVIYVPPSDERALAHEMLRLVSDETLRNTLSENGLHRSEAFSWEKFGAKLSDLINEISSS
jgi:glycosyltransferase involved in cell wall biosynthesis